MTHKAHRRLGAAAVTLALLLAACNSASSSGPASSTAPTQTPQATAIPAGCRTGLGITTSLSAQDMSGKATVTAAGVLLDEEGKIISCVIDVAENTFGANADGTLAMPAAYNTKWEQGDAYGLKAASGIGKEWYEQCQAFCDYVKGKTGAEVARTAVSDNRATEPDLVSGCTISVTPFISAVTKACDRAQSLGADPADILSLGAVSTAGGTDAADDTNGTAKVATTFVLLTRDAEGRVSSAVMDQIEPAFSVDTTGSLTEPENVISSKLEQGDAYGLKAASGIGKEWYEQSEGFCNYLKGKTAGEIRGIPASGTDADLAAVCTIDWTDMLQAAVKAAEAA